MRYASALQRSSWLGVLTIFALHNWEEWQWIGRHPITDLPWGLPVSLYSAGPLGCTMIVLTLMAAFPCVALGLGLGARGIWLKLAFMLAGGLGFNALSHLARAAVSQQYNPGLYSAGFLLGIVLLALISHWHPFRGSRLKFLLCGVLLTIPVIILALSAGQLLYPILVAA